MPIQGNKAGSGVALAADNLAVESAVGTILIVADNVAEEAAPDIVGGAGRNSVLLLSVLPVNAQSTTPSTLPTVRISVDGTDIGTLERRIQTRYQSAEAAAFGARWRDEGYWLLFPAALISLLWFRRGTTVPWIILLMLMQLPAPA